MNLKKCLLALGWLISPSAFSAEDPASPGDAEPGNISFSPSIEAAFDHSGKHVTHSFDADGMLMAEYHGTMGSVSVARVGADGRIEQLCTTDREAAVRFMSGAVQQRRESVVELHLEAR